MLPHSLISLVPFQRPCKSPGQEASDSCWGTPGWGHPGLGVAAGAHRGRSCRWGPKDGFRLGTAAKLGARAELPFLWQRAKGSTCPPMCGPVAGPCPFPLADGCVGVLQDPSLLPGAHVGASPQAPSQGDVLAMGKGFPSIVALVHPQNGQGRSGHHLPSSVSFPCSASRLPLQQRAQTLGSDLTAAAVGPSLKSPRWRGCGQGEPCWGRQRGVGTGLVVTCPQGGLM